MTFANEAELEVIIAKDLALGGTVWVMTEEINFCLNWLQKNKHNDIAVEMKKALISYLKTIY